MKEAGATRTTQQRLLKLSPHLLLGLMVLVFFGDLFFAGKTLAMRDTFCDFLPWRLFAGQAFASGHLPLWNPFDAFGKPFAADPQTAVFYPLHAPFYIMSAAWALKLSWALHLWIAGSSMFALARHWRLDTAPALIAAVSFMFSSWMLAYLEFFSSFTTVVWGPLTLLMTSRLIDHWRECEAGASCWNRLLGNGRRTVILALLLAVQYLAGHPEMFLYTLLLVAGFAVARCAWLRDASTLAGVCASCALAGLLAMGLALPQVLLSCEFLPYSERAQSVDPHLQLASLHPRHLLMLFMPFLYGRPGYPDAYWGGTIYEFWAGTCYVGIVPVILWLFCPLCLRGKGIGGHDLQRRFLCVFWCLMGLLGLLIAFGAHTPLYPFMLEHLPGFNRFRFPSKLLLWSLYAGALLAGFGYQSIVDFGKTVLAGKNARRWIWAIGSGLMAVWSIACLNGQRDPAFFGHLTNGQFPAGPTRVQETLTDCRLGLMFLGLGLAGLLARLTVRRHARWMDGLLLLIVFANLMVIGRQIQPAARDEIYTGKPELVLRTTASSGNHPIHSRYAPLQQVLYGMRDEGIFQWAKSVGMGDNWLPFGVSQAYQGGLKLDRNEAALSRVYQGSETEANLMADVLGIRYVVTGAKLSDVMFRHAAGDFGLVERSNCLPGTFLAGRWKVLSDPHEVLKQLLSPSVVSGQEALVELVTTAYPLPRSYSLPQPQPELAPASATNWSKVLVERGNQVTLDVQAGRRSLLVMNHSWYPGWTAMVDGTVAPIFRVNYLFRGVFLEPGRHTVEFVFEPGWLGVGIWGSLLTALVLLPLWVCRQVPGTAPSRYGRPA